MRQHFVDDNIRQRQIIAFPGRRSARKADDVRRTIGQTALGNIHLLRAERDRIEGAAVRGKQPDRFAFRAQFEIHVIRALVRCAVCIKLYVSAGPRANERKFGNRILGPVIKVVGQK
jgi:hypothetical protein